MHDWRNPERVMPWKPRQRFQVMPLGQQANGQYRAAIDAAQRGSDPRAEMDRAKQAWADQYRLRPPDGILLEDLCAGRTTLAELQPTLAACDMTLREARGSLDRLLAAGLIEAQEPARG